MVYFLSITGAGSAFVLCYGSDGHTEIELSYNGTNCSATFDGIDIHSDLSISEYLPDEHCGSCIDIPICINSNMHEEKKLLYQPDLKYLSYSVSSSTIAHSHQGTVINPSKFTNIPISLFNGISTVVLLI
jgi:hypothetical protein